MTDDEKTIFLEKINAFVRESVADLRERFQEEGVVFPPMSDCCCCGCCDCDCDDDPVIESEP